MTGATSMYPVIGQAATTAAAMRAAATLIESTGIAGLSVTCGDAQVSIQVCEDLGDPATRAALVARLAAAIGTGDLPLACTGTGQVAEATTPPLPAGWRWLTSLDPPAIPAGTEAA